MLSPLNLLGDIPLLGTIDDAGMLTLVLLWFTRASAPYQHTIDARRRPADAGCYWMSLRPSTRG